MKELKNTRSCWITWEIQTRNRSIANLLGSDLYELISKRSRVARYIYLSLRTIKIIKNYQIIFVQNPSIVLATLATVVRILTRKTVIIDAHNSGIYPLDGRSKVLNFLTEFICKNADIVIVTNTALADKVIEYKGKPFVLPDPIPNLKVQNRPRENPNEKYIFFICTWADDEPYLEVINAATKLSNQVRILISGKYAGKVSNKSNLPKNVTLLGFIDEDLYVQLLSNAIASIDLTTRNNCLVCGAYESASLSVPCIVTDNEINRLVFNSGFIYSKTDSDNIAKAIDYAVENNNELKNNISLFARNHNLLIEERICQLKKAATAAAEEK
jgi:glycosyltransferase involved in cell wall biosynthesis